MTESKDRRRGRQTAIHFNEGDHELAEWIAEYLGCTKADAVRSAIRAFAVHLQAISKSRI